MVIQFSKENTIVTVILGFIIFIILKKYYYGGLTMLYALFVGIQYALTSSMPGNKYLLYTSIPAYTLLAVLILTSFYVLYKSRSVKTPQTIFTISQLSVAVLLIVFLRFMKGKFELLNGSYINYLPTLFFLGFLISVSIIKDNQPILNKVYVEVKHDIDEYRAY